MSIMSNAINARPWRLAIFSALLMGVFLYFSPYTLYGDPRDETIVATVDGVDIHYGQIKVNLDRLRERAPQPGGIGSENSEEEIRTEQIRLQSAKLQKLIQSTVRGNQARGLRVQVTAADIQEFKDKVAHDEDPPQVKERNLRKQQLLIDALDRVYEKGEDQEVVFQSLLSNDFIEMEWEAALRQFSKPSARKLLVETVVGIPEIGMEDNRAVEAFLLAKKMEPVIDDQLMRTDLEFAEYVKLAKTDPNNDKVQSKGPRYRDEKRQEWWQLRYREANVMIYDNQLKDAWPPKSDD